MFDIVHIVALAREYMALHNINTDNAERLLEATKNSQMSATLRRLLSLVQQDMGLPVRRKLL